ncbi:phosphatases II [Pleomassaria siparia CBS 279.74]|uniref:Phosphatases II n=1 Tax=Pleomassaria siparia CBS 279.74 TaxID=1314801 RepID=A0A6G1KJW9_9PLEO|nr:phosphatases II [Pleomassaria siparia CBS 279.74]
MASEEAAIAAIQRPHKRHHEYTYRLPTPPRILVPPPTLTENMPQLSVGGAAEGQDYDLDTSFLKEMNLDSVVQKNTLLEWAYERRRQAQMILPWLYLGPMTAARDREFLTREGITMSLAIRAKDNSLNGAVLAGRAANLEVVTIEAPHFFNLIGHFSQATKMINQHVARVRKVSSANGNAQLGKVLVFCESGNEKSAAVVAAYLMETLDNFDHIKSMQVCQAQRFCVNFDDTIKNILRSHWDILQARRSVAHSRSELVQSTLLNNNLQQVASHLRVQNAITMKPKRTIEDIMDYEDTEMGEDMDPSDALRFSGRDITPFQDA